MNPTFYWATVALTIVVVIWRSKKWQGADWAWAIAVAIVAGGLVLTARLALQLAFQLGFLIYGSQGVVPEWLSYSLAMIIWAVEVLLIKWLWPHRRPASKNGSGVDRK